MEKTWEELADVVAAQVLVNALEVSERLTALGVPHALIGGLAVGLHGHPRATKDVDYLVGPEAFTKTRPLLVYRDELAALVSIGQVDLLAVPDDHPELVAMLQVPIGGGVPVLPVEAIVLLKLIANRPQDRADIVALLATGASLPDVTRFLRAHAPEFVARFAALAGG